MCTSFIKSTQALTPQWVHHLCTLHSPNQHVRKCVERVQHLVDMIHTASSPLPCPLDVPWVESWSAIKLEVAQGMRFGLKPDVCKQALNLSFELQKSMLSSSAQHEAQQAQQQAQTTLQKVGAAASE